VGISVWPRKVIPIVASRTPTGSMSTSSSVRSSVPPPPCDEDVIPPLDTSLASAVLTVSESFSVSPAKGRQPEGHIRIITFKLY
jgi:hypothetical protein